MNENYLIKSKSYKGFHYSVLKQEDLEYLHKTTVKIFKEVVAVFDKNNIPYMVVGGTLLGAYTTGKFIPWDDDLDVCIFDEDYEKAINLLCENMPDWILVQCNKTEPKYFHGWVKVRDKYSCVYPTTESYQCNGVWIDLYRIKRIKKKCEMLESVNEHINYLNRRFSVGNINLEEKNKRMLLNDLENKLLKAKEIAEKSEDNSYIYQIQSASRVSMEETWILPLSTVQFEGMTVTTIKEPEKYLIQHYGSNFFQLPPNELRRVGINSIHVHKK